MRMMQQKKARDLEQQQHEQNLYGANPFQGLDQNGEEQPSEIMQDPRQNMYDQEDNSIINGLQGSAGPGPIP